MQHKSKLVTLLIASNLLTLALFLTGCPNPDPDPVDENCYPVASSTTNFPGLNAMLVYKLAKGYKDRQLSTINNTYYQSTAQGVAPTDGDARSVWFDLETIKRFIYEIESKTCKGCDNNASKKLGVRIYYGTYPESGDPIWNTDALTGVDQSNAGKHTVMLVPTYRNSSNKNVDFDPQYITSGCNFTAIETFYDSLKTNPPTNVMLTVLSGMNSSAQNHGQMIPPPYGADNIIGEGAAIMYAADMGE